jgi:hypothetical protein
MHPEETKKVQPAKASVESLQVIDKELTSAACPFAEDCHDPHCFHDMQRLMGIARKRSA